MPLARLRFATLALLVLVLAGCGDGGEPDPSATMQATEPSKPPLATQTPLPSATATEIPVAADTASPGPQDAPSSVRLAEVATGKVTTLYEDLDTRASFAAFEGDGIAVRVGSEIVVFDLDGALVGNRPTSRECVQLDDAAEVAGRVYEDVFCGSVSPDGRWMTYPVDAGNAERPSGGTVPKWDQWLVDLETGETSLVQADLLHCGGCDFRYGPSWSATSRYVAYAEFGSAGRRFLTDAENGTTRAIGTGNELNQAPVWSPLGDMLVYSAPSGWGSLLEARAAGDAILTVLEDLDAGTIQQLELGWPAAFDASGALLYSPAWSPGGKEPLLETTIIEVASGNVVDTVAGAPPASFIWTGSLAVMASPQGLLVVLQQAEGCEGTAIYRGGSLATCIVGGVEGQIGPDGSVAVARETGVGFERFQTSYDIDIVTHRGNVTTVVTHASSYDAPLMAWNEGGTHLLVLWPRSVGI